MNRARNFAALLLTGLFFLFALSSCAGRSEKVVGSCGDYEILYEELRYETLLYRKDHPDCTEDELQAAVKQALCESYAIPLLCAEYLPGLGLDSSELNKPVDAAVKQAINDLGSKSAFKDFLKENNLTKHLLRRQLAIVQLQMELEEAIFGDDPVLANENTLLKWLDDGNFVRVRKIYFPLTDENGVSLREDAETFYWKLQNGKTPEDLTSKPYASSAEYRAPEYVYRDLDDSDISNAALSLEEIGDISDLIEAEDGYYIAIRVEDERETMATLQLASALGKYRTNRLNELIEEATATLTVAWNDYGSELKLTEIK